MTAREQLADVIEDAIDSVHDMDVTHRDYAQAAADAVLGMIKPLEWVTHPAGYMASNGMGASYIVDDRQFRPRFIKWPSGNFAPDVKSVVAAKAAANEHHAKQIQNLLGLAQEGQA